ncbi:hypothetical protein LUZ60_003235 [Juncus effusus]|nr:hypothetical protein LUZ60_003235 [Juncus effusus]
MYTTKPLSTLKATQSATQQLPQEGPNSGYLALQETDPDHSTNTCCFNICCGPRIKDVPFPQNKIWTLKFSRQEGENRNYYFKRVLFVPVLNLPLAANRYYVVVAKGKRKGQVFTCSKEEDMMTCCFCKCINDTKPQPFDYTNIYQQIEIIPHKGKFTAKAVASDGFAPWIFRQKYWSLHEKKSSQINEALGLNTALRSHLPEIEMPVSRNVGKWHCPFFFVKEKMLLTEQMERAMFYEVTLEQFWEKVYSGVVKQRVLFEGKEAMQQEGLSEGFVWFKKRGDLNLNEERIGLSVALWERVNWEENRGGWIDENGPMDLEVKFGSFVLVERFLIKRMDGSLVLALDFMHTNKVITK